VCVALSVVVVADRTLCAGVCVCDDVCDDVWDCVLV